MSLVSITSTHQVSIQRESVTTGAGLGPVRNWTTQRTGVLCRVRPLPALDVAALLKEGMRITHRLYFHDNPGVDERDRILYTDSGGTQHTFYVQRTRNPHEMDRFWVVEGEERKDVDNT